MPDYFKNLEQTIANVENENLTFGKKVKFWVSSHLRVIWSLIMMVILFFLCLWVTLKATDKKPRGALIEPFIEKSSEKIKEKLPQK
jgi:F0F1-type ATP synthase membrane subunit a